MPLNKVNYVHGQTIISAQNMNDIQDEIIRLGEQTVIQSNWSQNDETALDFIKNRTHWSNHQEGEFLNRLFEDNDGTWMFMDENAILPVLNCNEKYQVIIEDQVFESSLNIAKEFKEEPGVIEAYVFGDYSVIDSTVDSTGEPFVLLLIEAVDNDTKGIAGMLMLLDEIPREADGYRVKISGQFNSVTKLDEIYMPASYNVAKNTLLNLINQMDEAQSNISTNSDSILNIQTQLPRTLKYTSQHLTEEQKIQARKNIGAVGIDEWVQADLNETDESSLAFVKGTLRREHFPMSIPSLVLYHYGIDPISVPINNWIEGNGMFLAELTIEDGNLLEQMCEKGICMNQGDSYYTPLYRLDSIDIMGHLYSDANSTIQINFSQDYTSGFMLVLGNEKPTLTQINFAIVGTGFGTEGARELHPALLPSVAVKRYELNSLNFITPEDIDIICAEKVKVTFPQHGLGIKISYTDSKGVFHEKEKLPETSKTTYEVIKDTVITLDGNHFDGSTFILPEDNKYYTKISGSEIIPHMDFEIKYASGAPT